MGFSHLDVARLTPGELLDELSARQRKQVADAWWAERLAREKKLKALKNYTGKKSADKKMAKEAKKDFEELSEMMTW